MVVNRESETFLSVENRVAIEEQMEIRDYNSVVNGIEKKLIPLAGRNKYMFIEFPINEMPRFALETLYEIQLLGYIPIIANAEHNVAFRRNPNKLYTLITKGALVQINASSLIGENGRQLRKFAVRLCKHDFVHFISSGADSLLDSLPLSLTFNKYLRKKYSIDYVDYLQNNVKHVSRGTDFHARMPIKFK